MSPTTACPLPEKLSAALEDALGHFLVLAKRPEYRVDMMRVHNPIRGTCRICVAGAYLAKLVSGLPTERLDVAEVARRLADETLEQRLISRRLWALALLPLGSPVAETGRWYDETGLLDKDDQWVFAQIPFSHYEDNAEVWEDYMRTVIRELKARDL